MLHAVESAISLDADDHHVLYCVADHCISNPDLQAQLTYAGELVESGFDESAARMLREALDDAPGWVHRTCFPIYAGLAS